MVSPDLRAAAGTRVECRISPDQIRRESISYLHVCHISPDCMPHKSGFFIGSATKVRIFHFAYFLSRKAAGSLPRAKPVGFPCVGCPQFPLGSCPLLAKLVTRLSSRLPDRRTWARWCSRDSSHWQQREDAVIEGVVYLAPKILRNINLSTLLGLHNYCFQQNFQLLKCGCFA